MRPSNPNIAASVLSRLKNKADRQSELFNPLLARYVGFRLLYRVSISPYRDQFLIKGATMFLFWTGSMHRPTRDIDLLSTTNSDLDELAAIFRSVCILTCEDDGVVFDPLSVSAVQIREDQAYGGSRIRLTGYLGSARIPLQIDVGLGDAVIPGPVEIAIPGILSSVPDARMLGYTVESAIAEKLHAMVVLGLSNSRMKDFLDVALLAEKVDIDPDALMSAVEATFRRRRTELPKDVPVCMLETFRSDPEVMVRWSAFARKNAVTGPMADLEYVQANLRRLLLPPLGLADPGQS